MLSSTSEMATGLRRRFATHHRAAMLAGGSSSSSTGGARRSFFSVSDARRQHGAKHIDTAENEFYSALYHPRHPLRPFEPKGGKKEFVKNIRKCHGLYTAVYDELSSDLAAIGSGSVRDFVENERQKVASSLGISAPSGVGEKHFKSPHLLDSLLANLIFPKHVHKYFAIAANGASLFPSVIYTHMAAGLADYCMQAKQTQNVQDALRFVTYYRSPLMLEELYRLGYTTETAHRLVAKAHFMQFHAGNALDETKKDPFIFSSMTRKFYPCDSHVSTGSTDLGRDLEMQTARALCMNLEGRTPPVTVIASGDTGFYTDGAMHATAHLVEAKERGLPMPLIFLINANNSSISSRLGSGDSQEAHVEKLCGRFASYSSLIDPGFVCHAPDVGGGIKAMQQAVDQVLETGRPTYVISQFPFRPGGHANDQNPAPDVVVLDQFAKLKECLLSQLCDAAEMSAGHQSSCTTSTADVVVTGDYLAEKLREADASIGAEIESAILGNNVLTRAEALELSQPGALTVLSKEPGTTHELPVGYLTGTDAASGQFSGMGSDIFAKTLNREFDRADAAGREVRYVHQENHLRNTPGSTSASSSSRSSAGSASADSRGGVYGELNLVKDNHLQKKFVNFLPHESLVMQVGAAYRSVLKEGNLVFVKGPHTIFNEHARDHMKYGAYRFCDSGTHGNVIYMFDGGSIASFDSRQVPDGKGGEVTRSHWLARVGEHHNTPEYGSFASDANTVMALPFDLNAFQFQMREMVRLHDLGRMVVCVTPTAAFQLLHPKFPLADDAVVGVNDVFHVRFDGRDQDAENRRLVVVGWGPEAKMVAKVLEKEKVACDFFILAYNRAPNALVNHLMWSLMNEEETSQTSKFIDVLVVDGNPNAGLLSPVVTDIKRKIGFTRRIVFSECTIPSGYIPYGLGDCLMQEWDVREALRRVGAIEDAAQEGTRYSAGVQRLKSTTMMSGQGGAAATAAKATTSAGAATAGGDTSVIVKSPLDGENVYVTFCKQIGEEVQTDDLIAEIESDKATVEIKAPKAGVVAEYFVEEKQEINLAASDAFCRIELAVGR